MAANGIDFIDKYDARRVFFRLLEHISNAGCANTDKHFDKIGTRNSEEWYFCLAGNRFG